ncbi:MAG: ABC transporter substrate-binding protein [Rhodospirillales bacterium]|nr:ABC transporter substrate-binding protein [Rhodospirillales bacterium]
MTALALGAVFLLTGAPAPVRAEADTVHVSHAIAMHGEPKYDATFEHFDYVNPDAPKGGSMRLGVQGTFDSFNPFIIRGNPFSAIGVETLTVSSADEPFTRYGLIAERIAWPEDRSWVTFTLRPEARWHDGTPITVEDVIFSFETLKAEGAPFYRFYYASIVAAENVGDRAVKFTFAEAGNRELPLIAGEIPILSKAYWQDRDFTSTTLEPPLASGPYKITQFEAGRFVVTERVADYWGKDLAVNQGINNFDQLRYEYFRDDTVIRQALKAGVLDYREENQAKAWALDYDVPAVREGLLKKELIPHMNPTGMQAFAYNTRRPPFQDPKVREALAYAFDFEWTNRALFFGQYTRTESYFSNSELASTGLPTEAELAILEPFRGSLPERVFTQAYRPPQTDGSGWPRDNLKTAFALLEEAGWEVRDMKLVNVETGQPMRFEILLVSPAFERVVLPFVRNLGRLGIEVSVRLVDQSQYINRIRDFDFDMIIAVWGQSESPGNEQRDFWGSKAADLPGSRNYTGVSTPVVDELIEMIIQAPDRESLVTRTRALDRVLLWGFYVIPNWHIRFDRILYWDKFDRPEVTPPRGTSISYWWYDPDEVARLNQRIFEQETQRLERDDPKRMGMIGAWAAGLSAVGLLAFYFVLKRRRSR